MGMELLSDLIEEILSWLPAKSILRLKYTCNKWETLIAQPRFVNKHLSRMRGREQQFKVFINAHSVYSSCPSSTVSCVGIDFNKPENSGWKLQFSHAYSPAINISHCDGLLLYVTESMLLVSNPLLKQERWIECSSRLHHANDIHGLGYISNQSSSPNDYKVVRFQCIQYSSWSVRFGYGVDLSSPVEVYEFKTDSWKVVVDKNFDGFNGLPLSSVCLRGTPYWLGYNKNDNQVMSIQSFNFLKERFEPLFLPPSSIGSCSLETYLSLGIFRGEQVSLLQECRGTNQINLWVMKQQHWSRLMTVAIPQYPISGKYLSSFIEENRRLALFIESKHLTFYIGGENQEYQTYEYYTGIGRTLSDCCYVPSLLQVPGF